VGGQLPGQEEPPVEPRPKPSRRVGSTAAGRWATPC